MNDPFEQGRQSARNRLNAKDEAKRSDLSDAQVFCEKLIELSYDRMWQHGYIVQRTNSRKVCVSSRTETRTYDIDDNHQWYGPAGSEPFTNRILGLLVVSVHQGKLEIEGEFSKKFWAESIGLNLDYVENESNLEQALRLFGEFCEGHQKHLAHEAALDAKRQAESQERQRVETEKSEASRREQIERQRQNEVDELAAKKTKMSAIFCAALFVALIAILGGLWT